MMIDKQTILTVIPDQSLLNELDKQLSSKYTLLNVNNGRYALHKLHEFVPSLVIAQYQIPAINGLSLCHQVKFHFGTKIDLPFLLISKVAIQNEPTTGLEAAPDKTIEAPFAIQEITNAVQQLLQHRPTKSPQTHWFPSMAVFQPTGQQQKQYQSIKQIIENHVDNSDFSVKEFSKQLHMSRMQLYRSTHTLFQLSPSELLKECRLNKAVHLLLTTDQSIKTIAYQCGFSQPSYFSKCFKERFGRSPKNYRNEKR